LVGAELVLPVLTVVSGLQLLRLMMATVVGSAATGWGRR
jgi:hypothetical protein